MSLLPGQMLPQTEPLGTVNENGTVTLSTNYWLLFYNLCLQVLGTNNSGLPSSALQELASADTDAIDADAITLRRPVSNLETRQADYTPSSSELPDIARALLLAQEPLLPDPQPRAQPVATITPTGSPFTYTAAFDGTVVVTGGTVSALALIRQGTSIALGITTGPVPLSRLDQLQVTYSGAPTMNFLPR
jgi:hypothetical protein